MKFLDTNVFLRYLIDPATEADKRKHQSCTKLFGDVQSGTVKITTCESVFHEVLYVLCSSRQYRLSHEDAAARLRPLLALRAFHLPRKRLFTRALELFTAHSFLDFADAMCIVQSQAGGDELLSYDEDWDDVPGIERLEP